MTKLSAQPSWRKNAERANGLLSRIVCVFDDIPFLLREYVGNVGPYLLVAAGFVVFPIQIFEGLLGLHEAWMKYRKFKNLKKPGDPMPPKIQSLIATSTTRIGLALVGIGVTAALLSFVLMQMAVLEGAASIAIPAIMTIISAAELVSDIFALRRAKQAYMANPTQATYEKLIEAKRDTIFSGISLGFGLAITALATLGVLSGLSVVSFGVIPSAVLIGVVVVALAVKIFEMIDDKKENRFTNKIRGVWNKLFGGEKILHHDNNYNNDDVKPLRRSSSANIIASTGGRSSREIVAQEFAEDGVGDVFAHNNNDGGYQPRSGNFQAVETKPMTRTSRSSTG